MEGILLVDKPSGITSHDVVDITRRKLAIRKVGHAGTLDPLATGLLIILIGKATKLFDRFSGCDKEYEATLKLGASTITGDSQGKIEKQGDYSQIKNQDIQDVLAKFKGEILQVPPMVSALRYKGKRLYQLARRGEQIDLPARKINIKNIYSTNINIPYIDFCVYCSKGTYIRKLAQDIGEELGCFAHITGIRRTKIGEYSIENAVNIDEINESNIKQTTTFSK